jgi:toxin ParE1/3/4
MRLELAREAEQDVEAACEWYDARRAGLGMEFLAALAVLLERIEAAPESFSRPEDYAGTRDLRQGLLRRFPYKVLFEIRSDGRLLGLAIAHTSRRPGFWQDRVE